MRPGTATPAGQRRVTEAVARQFNVERRRHEPAQSGMGYGEIATRLALSAGVDEGR